MTHATKCENCTSDCDNCPLISSLNKSINQAEELKKFYLEKIISRLVTQEKPKLPDKHNLN